MKSKKIIQRYLSQAHLTRMESDFKFLIDMFPDFDGELDIALRGTYFNIYYRGNSLAKVEFLANGNYRIGISDAFYEGSKASKDKRFVPPPQDDTVTLQGERVGRTSLTLSKEQLYPFFQKAHLSDFRSRIKKRSYSEEVTLEQAIITDNRERDDLIIIDRQVQDTQWKERMDLLALQQVEDGSYQFRVLEVKLGSNTELADAVAKQLQGYVDHITAHFDDYKTCYEEVYRQRKELGLHEKPSSDSITITQPVQGSVVVLGYSGLAAKALKMLRSSYPNIHVYQFHYRI